MIQTEFVMIHVIQENLFKERHYDLLLDTMNRYELPYVIVRVYPFVDWVVDVQNVTDDFENVEDLPYLDLPGGRVFCWGSLKLSRIAKDNGWDPGVLFNDNFDFKVYSEWWAGDMLNEDSIICKIGDDLPWDRGTLFLRPTADSKAFTGATFDKENWERTKAAYIDESSYPAFNADTDIQVSTPKRIEKEIRLWVVDGEIVTGSYYSLGGKSFYSSDVEPAALEFAMSVISRGALADAFVLDVCMSGGEWKVVEAGCINHAGFYDADLGRVVEAVERKFNPVGKLKY